MDVAAFKQFHTMYRSAFPDVRIQVDDVIAEGDKVATRLTLHAVHTGEFQGMPATGKKIAVQLLPIKPASAARYLPRISRIERYARGLSAVEANLRARLTLAATART